MTFAAADLAEQASLLGLLDKLADPFYDLSMPDDLLHPNGLMLILAVAVRIACNPENFGVPDSTSDDTWASRSTCQLLESVHPYVFSTNADEDRGKTRGVHMFAVDLFLEYTIMTMQSDLDVHEHEQAMSKETVDFVRMTMQNALETMHCLGLSICVDVCGATTKQRDGTSGLYTEFGLAHGCCDPVREARNQAAYEGGLGNLSPWSPTTRTSTRSARQKALVDVFGRVERWLTNGTHNGIVLPPRTNVPVCEGATELCVKKTYDESGNVSTVTIRREPLPKELVDATSNVEEVKKETTPSSSTGSKKKQRAAAKRDAKANGASDTLSLAAETKRRNRAASESALSNRQRERARAHREKLRKETLLSSSVVDGGAILSNIFQQGVAPGVTDSFDVDTFLVGRSSSIRCAHCPRFVNVVEVALTTVKLSQTHLSLRVRVRRASRSPINLENV